MDIWSNPIFIRAIIAISFGLFWGISGYLSYTLGHRNGYIKCMENIRAKKRAKRKPFTSGDIRVLDPTSSNKKCYVAESVRIVSTHPPKQDE